MAEFQNLLTPIQVRHAPDPGIPLPGGKERERSRGAFLSYLYGKIGDAQVGPIYLGWLGVTSLLCGFIAFEIIGFNMLASVGWDPIQFIRLLPWLALEPPRPTTGWASRRWLRAGGGCWRASS